jgi:hypothetical protein
MINGDSAPDEIDKAGFIEGQSPTSASPIEQALDKYYKPRDEKRWSRVFRGMMGSMAVMISSEGYILAEHFGSEKGITHSVAAHILSNDALRTITPYDVLAGGMGLLCVTAIYGRLSRMRGDGDKKQFVAGWNANATRLDPDGFIEASFMQTENAEAVQPAILDQNALP